MSTAAVIPLRAPAQDAIPALDAAALHGPLGELTRRIDPHTESDPVAILVQSLIAFGSMLGRSAHYQVEASRHYTNEFAVLVGASAKARKGSSLDQVLSVMRVIDPDWAERRLASGLSTGEGLIWKLRDSGDDDAGGDQDKRLLVIEAEFASVLKVAKRQDSTLSAIVRNAWDGKALETITKTSPARASEAHISLIGHITRDELARNVDATEIANGFLNRFMHFAVRSSKVLPFEGEVESVDFGD
ncbi:MAG: hypothetical protein QOJ98_3595, partial [Acidobacteriota bacterium]|nr:hypothetical protein [Acidobacteriota bacterium]